MKQRASQSRAWWWIAPALVLLGLLGALRTPWGLRTALKVTLGESGMSFEDARGNWARRIDVFGLRFEGGGTTLAVDTVRVRFSALALARGNVHIRRIVASGVDLTLGRTDADTTDAQAMPAVHIDEAVVRRSQLTMPLGEDTSLVVGIDFVRGALMLGSEAAMGLDTMSVAIHAGGEPLRIGGAIELKEHTLSLDSVRVTSSRTAVMLTGRANLPGKGLPGVDTLEVHAVPLALGDVALLTGLRGVEGPLALQATVTDHKGGYRLFGEGAVEARGTVMFDVRAAPDSAYEARLVAARDLDLSLLDTSLVGTISADLTATLANAGAWTGGLHLQVLDGSLAGVGLGRGDVHAAIADGKATAALDFQADGFRVAMTGEADLGESPPPYVAEGRFSRVDLAHLGASTTSDLRGTLNLEGRGTQEATLAVRTGEGLIGTLPLVHGVLDASLHGGMLDIGAVLAAESGSLTAKAHGVPGDPEGEIRISISTDRLDVAGAMGMGVSSAISGVAVSHMRGFARPDSASAFVALTDSRWDHYAIDSMHAQAALRDSDAVFGGHARLALGTFQWAGRGRPFDAVPAFTIDALVFDSVDIGLWADGWRSALQGTTTVSGLGGDNVAINLLLKPSTVNAQAVDSGRVALRLGASHQEADVALFMPAGAALDFTAVATSPDASIALARMSFRNLDLGAILDMDNLSTQLTGTVDTLGITGAQPAAWSLEVAANLEASRINEQLINEFALHLQADSGRYGGTARAAWNLGGLHIDSIRGRWFDATPSYALRATAQALDLNALAGLPATFSGAVDIAGAGTGRESLKLQRVRVAAERSQYRDVSIQDFAAALTLADGLLTVDTVRLASNALRLSGRGQLPIFGGSPSAHTFAVGGAVLDAQPLAGLFSDALIHNEWAPGDTLWIATRGAGDTLAFDGHVQFSSTTGQAIRVLDAAAGVSGTLSQSDGGHRTIGLDSLWADLRRVSVPGLSARSATGQAALRDDTLAFEAHVTIDEERSAHMKGLANVAQKEIVMQQLNLALGSEQWHLDQESHISYQDAYRVRNLLLVERDQEIALDGIVDPDGRQSLVLTLFDVRPASVADLFGFPGLGGVVNGEFVLTGEAEAPLMEGMIAMTVASSETPVGTLHGAVAYADGRLSVDARLEHVDKSTLQVAGYLPADLRLNRIGPAPPTTDEVAMRIESDRFNVGWVEPFLDPEIYGDVEGRLTGTVMIGGTMARPQLTGTADLDAGMLDLPALGITAQAIEARSSFQGDSVLVSHLSAQSGPGTLNGSGHLGMTDLTLGSYDLRVDVDRFRVMGNEGYLAHVTGGVRLSGTTARPELSGRIRLVNADIRPTEAANQVYAPVAFTPEDVRMLERYFNIRVTSQDTTTFVFYDALAMDLNVVVADDVWLRSRTFPEMNVRMQGMLDLSKAPGEEPEVQGTVQVEPAQSYVRQFGRRFDIETGRITFTGPPLNPLVELRASYEVPAQNSQDSPVTIYLDVFGRALDEGTLALRLSSDPANLEESDIISYIATGRPAAEAFQMATEGSLQAGSDIALGRLTNLIAGAAGEELGLDMVKIEVEGSRGVTLTAGKRIARDFLATVSWPIAIGNSTTAQATSSLKNNKQVNIEYALFAWLLARLRGDTESIGASLVVQYAY